MDAIDCFIVNNFMFCADHGQEFRPSCFCDYRACNNDQVDLDEATIQKLEEIFLDFDDRPSLNAYAFGARLANKKDWSYKCKKHGTIDCEVCFDWARLIVKSMAVVERLNATMGVDKGTKEVMATAGEEEREVHGIE